jgi:hypothetical protein
MGKVRLVKITSVSVLDDRLINIGIWLGVIGYGLVDLFR